MTDSSADGNTPGLRNLRFDRRLLTAAEVLAGTGAVLWVAGWVVGMAAVRRAVQDWIEQLDQAPSELAFGKWQQLLEATTAGTNAYKSRISKGA